MKETWLPVPDWEGLYEVSDQGRVRSIERTTVFVDGRRRKFRGKVLKPSTINRDGRRTVPLSRGSARTSALVYRLVLAAFVGPCPEGMEGCHNNGIASDDRLENLRYDTRSANMLDKIEHGTIVRGTRHKLNRLTEEQVREIRQTYIFRHPEFGGKPLAKKYGVSRTTISSIVNDKHWRWLDADSEALSAA